MVTADRAQAREERAERAQNRSWLERIRARRDLQEIGEAPAIRSPFNESGVSRRTRRSTRSSRRSRGARRRAMSIGSRRRRRSGVRGVIVALPVGGEFIEARARARAASGSRVMSPRAKRGRSPGANGVG